MRKNSWGKRVLAAMLLFIMVVSVVADCNLVTVFAVNNESGILESENIPKAEDYQEIIPVEAGTNSIPAENQPNILTETPVIIPTATPAVLEENHKENNLVEKEAGTNSTSADVPANIPADIPTETPVNNSAATPAVLEESSKEDSLTEEDSDSNPNNIPDALEKNSDSEGIKKDNSNPVHEEKSEENSDFNKELTVDGYKITIKADEGVFPVGTNVEIETVDTIDEEEFQDVISEEVEELEPSAQIVKTVTFDINFYSQDGKLIEPENGSVNIAIVPDLMETFQLQEIEQELGQSLECSVFHVDEELNVEEVECEVKEDYTEVSFDAESFSNYVVTWYAAPVDGEQEVSTAGPNKIGTFENSNFGFRYFKVPIAWDNDDGDSVLRPDKLTFTIYGTDKTNTTDSATHVKICDITIDTYDKEATNPTIDLTDGSDIAIPVYILEKTGKKEYGGSATYVMENFQYEVKLHDEHMAYSSGYVEAEGITYSAVTTDRDLNNTIWYATANKITNVRKNLSNASFKIEWYDNHNEDRVRPYSENVDIIDIEKLKTEFELYYYVGDSSTPKLVTDDMMPAGKDATGPFVTSDSYSSWSISYKNLLPEDENGDAIHYMLKLSNDFAPNYKADSSDDYIIDTGRRKYSLLGEFKANIRWNDGGMKDELRPASALKFIVKDSEDNILDIPSEDINIINRDGNIWEFAVDNLVKYSDSDNSDSILSYYVTLDGSKLPHYVTPGGSELPLYEVSYTNAPDSTDVSKCHDGGTIFVTLDRELDKFTITKEWKDNGDTGARDALIDKGVTLYLWRYPVNKIVKGSVVPGTIADGAPVNDENGEQYHYKLENIDDDFKIHLSDFADKLEMYDTQGYQYVYYVTEIMNGNQYVTSYSNVSPYTHIETAVADGGKLINLRRESIRVEGIVRWRVPSVTDYTKASATINLQRFDEESMQWTNVGSHVIVTGFTEADPQKKHVFPAVDKYDELGRVIKYRVIETNINYNGHDIGIGEYTKDSVKDDYYAAHFSEKMNGYDYTATAHPTWESPKTESEKYSFTVDNRMSGDVTLDIKKVWKTEEKYAGHYSDITINIFRKNYTREEELFRKVIVSGVDPSTGNVTPSDEDRKFKAKLYGADNAEMGEINVTAEDVSTAEGTNLEWTFEGIELDEFDSNGNAYTYSIKETGIDANTHASYNYSFDGNDIRATVTNTYVTPGGGSIYFEIDKEWIDGADLSQRQPVTVAIVNVNPETGKYNLEDNEGKTHEFTLSAENNWHHEEWLSEHYTDKDGIAQNRFNKDSSGNWLWTVIEENVTLREEYEKLSNLDLSADDNMDIRYRPVNGYPENLLSEGTGRSSITGNVDAIVHNDIHKPGYKVTINAISDEENPSVFGASKYKITNERVGKVNVTFDKTWHDSDNRADTRGDALRVKLYQNGKLVVATATDDPNKVFIEGIDIEPNDPNPAQKDYLHDKNGTDESHDVFKFKNLPKYDDHGVAYQYSVREFMVRINAGVEEEIEISTNDTEDTTRSGYIADIDGHEAKVTFDTDVNKQIIRNELYKYSNTLTGKLTTEVPFYVIWHDQSSYENGGRPDMYFTLYYRTLGSTSDPVKFEGDYKVRWEAEKENGNSNPYYKTAKFTGLPLADENGNVYEFFAAASLNNAAEHYDERYFIDNHEVTLSSAPANSSESIHHYDIREGGEDDKESLIQLDSGHITLLPVDGLIEYIIDEKITPKGKKTWQNVEQGITAKNLPNVKIYLGRFSKHDTENKMYDEPGSSVDISNNLDWTTLDTDKLSYNFGTLPNGEENPEAKYDKYDYYGEIYTYQLAEEIFVNSSANDKKYDYKVPGYIMKYNPDSLNLANIYLPADDLNRGTRKITVTKNWEAKSGTLTMIDGKCPQARFKLYRMEVDPANCRDEVSPEGSIPYNPVAIQYTNANISDFTECPSEVANEIIITYDSEEPSRSKSWSNLPIYAPSGRPYLYAVKETDAHGLSAYTITNNATNPLADGGNRDNRQIGNNEKEKGAQVLISNYGLIADANSDNTNNQQSVEFTNKLNNDKTINIITGKKEWTDGSYAADVRPDKDACNTYVSEGIPNTGKQLELRLRRTAKSQTGASNTVITDLTEGVHYKVEWKQGDSDKSWKYEITPIGDNEFQMYAPNGLPYTYMVTEVLYGVVKENYKATVSSASKLATYATTNAEGKTILEETTTLKNGLKGQIQLSKKWDDALNEFELRSGYVDVILQYRKVRKDDTVGYNDESNWITYKENGKDVVYRLDEDNNKWKKSITTLPIEAMNGTEVYEYRVLEVGFEDHVKTTLNPVIYTPSSGGVESIVKYKPNKDESDEQYVPIGYRSSSDPAPRYNNSKRFDGSGHFETKVGNYIVNHSEIVSLISDNSRTLQVENFLSDKAELTIEKKWNGIKGLDDYEVLPNQIVYEIQYSTDKTDWKPLKKQGSEDIVTATVYKEHDWKQLVELPFTTEGVHTFYRAVELGRNLGRFEGYNADDELMTEGSEEPSPTTGVVYNHYGAYIPEESRMECSTIATNTLDARDLTVKKKWNDGEGVPHGDVVVQLCSYNYNTGVDGSGTLQAVPGTEVTLKASDSYQFTYHNLPKKNTQGKPIVYYIKELKVDGADYNSAKYDTAFFVSMNGSTYEQINPYSSDKSTACIDEKGTAQAVCIVNTPKSTLRVTKKWDDEKNRHKLRRSVSFELYYYLTDSTRVKWPYSITSDTNDKTYLFEKLPIYNAPDVDFVTNGTKHNMGKVTYEVTENNTNIAGVYNDPVYTVNGTGVPLADKATIQLAPSAANNNVHILNKMNVPKANITADKVWFDNNNLHGSRATEIKLSLYYRVKSTDNWKLITKKQLSDGNYPDGEVYTTSDVTQPLSQNELVGLNEWHHTETFAIWRDLPLVDKNNNRIYYKVLETNGEVAASVSPSYTGDFSGYDVTYKYTNGSSFVSNGESANQEVYNTLKGTAILVEKEWQDTIEQNVRPSAVTFELEYKHADKPWRAYKENGENKKIVLTGDKAYAKWTQTVNDLPYKDAEGHEYEYRLKEVSMTINTPSGPLEIYDQVRDDSNFEGTTWKGEIGTFDNVVTVAKASGESYNYKFTAVNTPEVGNITVTKVWDDSNNRDGLRPSNIEVILYRDGKEYSRAEIGPTLSGTSVDVSGNKWTYTWNNLPKYKDDAETHNTAHMSSYYVVENPLSGDASLYYKSPTYGPSEDSITNIYASHIQSHVSDNTDTDLWLKNSHETIRFKLDARKKWDDINDQHELRPASVNLILEHRIFGSGSTWTKVDTKPIAELDTTGRLVETTSDSSLTVYASNAITGHPDIWELSSGWDNLPAYIIDSAGKTQLVEYRIREEWPSEDPKAGNAEHYEAELPHFHYHYEQAKAAKEAGTIYPADSLYVINMADYNSTVTVEKEWDNEGLIEKYGALPKEVHVKLQRWNGNKWEDCIFNDKKQTAVLKEHEGEEFENSWTHTFQELIPTDTYRVIEEKLVFGDGSSVSPIGITDNDVHDAGNGKIGNFTITAEVEELAISGHDGGGLGTAGSKAKHWVAKLTNSMPNRSIKVVKNWNDEGDRDKLRPAHIYVTLQRDGNNHETVMLNEANNWTHEWEYLPLCKDGTAQISTYRVLETDDQGIPESVEQYETVYDITKSGSEKEKLIYDFDLSGLSDGGTAEITITNTHEPAKTTVYAGKNWVDDNNKYGERPDKIYLALFYRYPDESEDVWHLIENEDESESDSGALYKDSLIYTTSEPVQEVTGQSSTDQYWKNVAIWKNLPSQAIVEGDICIPEYRVVEVKGPLSTKATLSDALGDSPDKVISGYTTTQPEAFIVHGGVSGDHIVVNNIETVKAHIIKKWTDQNNRFANRPTRVDFAIQKKKGDDGSWELLTETVNGKTTDKIVSVNPEMSGDDADTLEILVDYLPQYSMDGKKLSYRAVEISLAYADRTVDVFDKEDFSENLAMAFGSGKNGYKVEEEGPLRVELVDSIEYQTKINNTRDSLAKVTAAKVWDDYKNNRNTRPLSVVFAIEKRQVHEGTIAGLFATIIDLFKDNNGWMPVYELNSEGEKVPINISLDGPDFNEVSVKGLPLYDDYGKELVYRAREIKLVYEEKDIEIDSDDNSYLKPTYVDDVSVAAVPDGDGVTHSYTTKATNKIKPDPPTPPLGGDGDPEIPIESPEDPINPTPATPSSPLMDPVKPIKPVLPPVLKELDEEIDNIKEPEDIVPIVEALLELPDSKERDYVVNKLWVVVVELESDPTFYDHFDSEMQDILKNFVKSGVLGKRRRLPKTGGLMGSFIIMLLGFALIGVGVRFNKKR